MEDNATDEGVRRVLDTEEAARHVGCSPGHLVKLRQIGGGPNFHRLFRRKGIRYTRVDLDRWVQERRYGSTTEYPEAFA